MYLVLPTEKQKEDTRMCVNATKDSIKRDVQCLIEWISKQPHLPKLTDEELLAHCLLNCKNSMEKTKRRLETYFLVKKTMPEIFLQRDPYAPEIEQVNSLVMYVPLPKMTPDGYRVFMLYVSDKVKHTQPVPFNHFLKASFMTIDIIGKYDYPKGVILVHDGKNIGMPFVTHAATELHKLITLATKTVPARYHRIYFLNMNPAAEILINIGRALLKKELASRIEVLKNSNLCEVLPASVIPQDYDGKEVSLEVLKDKWYDELKEHKDFLRNTENYVGDISKKPPSLTSVDMYGINGSFRKMNID